ncbi:hypothetical protein COU20_02725 [Candidatus Kaiserbacteria bacterium CG10_big_fil_rev_8_21_14_0_10_59_10]|uniref:Major facilitator superfamily (MFS) profile domain-containing protein n=1 Tax=Candidatus Kaiserbacteria bacterium CG10_big_fil_rev_8_21_14_0_10_59_10 TaxID=1974612 RepID=A0A2H0U7M3_9BACT|nr:MAG: hypothetical protein COU20_02725 [Candidatus Kaiserbacteria bacterium CG10_big_fil_rev_8_21_14_0_10_59_10]
MVTAAQLRRGTYITNFVYALQFGLLLFFSATFLVELGFSTALIGVLFTAAYGASLALLIAAPALLRVFGNYKLFPLAAAALSCIAAALVFPLPAPVAAFLVMCTVTLNVLLLMLLDLFLETLTGDETKTGVRRGLFITILHAALVVAQLLAGAALALGGFSLLYAAAAFFSALVAILALVLLRGFREPEYESVDWQVVRARLVSSSDLRASFYAQFLLRFFNAAMIVYTPIYLYEHIGIPLSEMGIIFAATLIPFLLLEIPLGKLEDTKHDERFVLVIGFIVLAFSTALLSFVTTPAVVVWAALLFATRVGAAMVEMGNEVHFFRQVSGVDATEMDAFRMLVPLSHTVAPIVGALFLLLFPIQYIFLALAGILIIGIPVALGVLSRA